VLDHAGMPIERDAEGLARWRSAMARLAQCPNVHVKISALGTLDHHWTVESLRPYVLEPIRLFGAERCMVAGNFPVDGLYSTYARLFAAFDEITADLTGTEREQIFWRTAATFYRLDVDVR
jgi:predicted TIM-barrel fold metal-dependent hydrolase